MIKVVVIPKERMAVLIGMRGSVKHQIEKKTDVRITVTDDITIDGNALDVMTAENIVKAIGRGFAPEKAMMLVNEDITLIVIKLPKEKNILKRIRSRLIGTKGKVRKNIEQLTHTYISVYGKTVSIIGSYEDTKKAVDALNKIIKGYAHKSVYKFLESSHDR